jgi:hypothetical protein
VEKFLPYNLRDHTIPFHKAIDLGKPTKKLAGEQAQDLEEASVSFKLIHWVLADGFQVLRRH